MNSNQNASSGWDLRIALVVISGLILIALFLFNPIFRPSYTEREIPLAMHSNLKADYRIDSSQPSIRVSMRLIEQAFSDRMEDPDVALDQLRAELSNPVPTVTPMPTATSTRVPQLLNNAQTGSDDGQSSSSGSSGSISPVQPQATATALPLPTLPESSPTAAASPTTASTLPPAASPTALLTEALTATVDPGVTEQPTQTQEPAATVQPTGTTVPSAVPQPTKTPKPDNPNKPTQAPTQTPPAASTPVPDPLQTSAPGNSGSSQKDKTKDP